MITITLPAADPAASAQNLGANRKTEREKVGNGV